MDIWDENFVIIVTMVLRQQLHILTYDRQNVSGDRPHLRKPLTPTAVPKMEALESPLVAKAPLEVTRLVLTRLMKQALSTHAPQQPRKLRMATKEEKEEKKEKEEKGEEEKLEAEDGD